MKKSVILIFVFMLVFTILFFIPIILAQRSSGFISPSFDNSYSMPKKENIFNGKIYVSGIPKVGSEITVSFEVFPLKDLDSLILFDIPQGLEVSSGKIRWKSHLNSNKRFLSKVNLKIKSEGNYTIRAFASSTEGDINENYYFTIEAGKDFGALYYNKTEIPTLNKTLKTSNVIVKKRKFVLDGKAEIAGSFRYTDDRLNKRPIRYVDVELYSDEEFLGSARTDSNGDFSVTRDFIGCHNVYAKIYSEHFAARITNDKDARYSIQTESKKVCDDQSSTWNLGEFVVSGEDSLPWQALDYSINIYAFFDRESDYRHPKISIVYPTGDWPYFYGPEPEGVGYIKLPTRDFYDWNRVVIYHEYAHSVMNKIYYDNKSPGPQGCEYNKGAGGHWYTLETCNGFAFLEGWAEFIQAAVEEDSSAVSNFRGDIESNNWWKGDDELENNKGDIVEGAVASILWDIFDPANDDSVSERLVKIFGILKMDNPGNVTDFWHNWFSMNDKTPVNYGYQREMAQIFYNNGVREQYICPDSDKDEYADKFCGGLDCNDFDSSINPGSLEVCDSLDNNCNNVIDEGCGKCKDGQKIECGKNVGICKKGMSTCLGGQWGACEGATLPRDETCPPNGADDDCDGLIDEANCERGGVAQCTDLSKSGAVSGDPDIAHRFKGIGVGDKCANEWIADDIDKDGYTEFYMLLGSDGAFLRTWATCRANQDFGSYKIDNFYNYNKEIKYGCTADRDVDRRLSDSYCDSDVEYTYYDRWFFSPEDELNSASMFCSVDGYVFGFYGRQLAEEYPGGHEEPYYILKCGRDTDCRGDEYCKKPNTNNPLTYYCANSCGNGICENGENCPADFQSKEICDNIDNNCNGIVDEDLPITCKFDSDCIQDGCYFGTYRDYSCINSGTCNSKCVYTEKLTDHDRDGFDIECELDCNDDNPDIWPGKPESCDGIDNNCNKNIDEGLVQPPCEKQQGVCKGSLKTCGGNLGWLDCKKENYGEHYEEIETSCDTLDNDCDGTVDENCQKSPTKPTSLTCNNKACLGTYSEQIELKCSGSTDKEGDKITYNIEANLDSTIPTPANWWNQDWKYRKTITFTENAGHERINEPVRIVFPHGGNVDYSNNCRDIRVIDQNNNEIPYQGKYEDSSLICDSTTAEVWILANAKASASTDYYVYYGNPDSPLPSYQTTLDAQQPASSFNINVDGNKLSIGISHCSDNCRICHISSEGDNILRRFGSHIVSESSTDCSKVDILQKGTIMARYGFDNYFSIPNGQIRVFDKNNILDIVVDNTPQTSELTGGCELDSTFSGNSGMGCPASIVYSDRVATYADIPEYNFPTTPTLYNIKNSPQGEIVSANGVYGWHVINENADIVKARSPPSDTGYAYLNWGNTQKTTQYFFRGFIGNLTAEQLQTEQEKFANSLEKNMQISNEESVSSWQKIGSHLEDLSFVWDISGLVGKENIKLRCRAIDKEGSNIFSDYYTVESQISIIEGQLIKFKRGDVNDDGAIDIGDVIVILDVLFNHVPESCLDSADTNDDGEVNIADPIYLLNYLFVRGKEPPAPFSSEGVDTTPDSLTCEA